MGFWNDGTASSRPARSRSYYSSSGSRARPRQGYVNRILATLRRFVRDLYYYARRHPVKVFMLVVLPLLTGGALPRILAQFGIRMPPGLLKAFGGAAGGHGGDYGREFERFSARSEGGGGIQNLIGMAKMFM